MTLIIPNISKWQQTLYATSPMSCQTTVTFVNKENDIRISINAPLMMRHYISHLIIDIININMKKAVVAEWFDLPRLM